MDARHNTFAKTQNGVEGWNDVASCGGMWQPSEAEGGKAPGGSEVLVTGRLQLSAPHFGLLSPSLAMRESISFVLSHQVHGNLL